MAKHPPVNTAKWFRYYEDDRVSIDIDENDTIFMKVVVDNKTKYFYNETAHSDVARYLVDTTRKMKYWSVFI